MNKQNVITPVFKAVCFLVLLFHLNSGVYAQNDLEASDQFLQLLSSEQKERNDAFEYVVIHWQESFIPMALEVLDLSLDPEIVKDLVGLLEDKTEMQFGQDLNAWYTWLWAREQNILPDYGDFKAQLYGYIEPNFESYFKNRTNNAAVRLDEIRWAGVVEEDIPPLRDPKMVSAKDALYLDDDNLVFGVELNGDARAYPERILAWHEMFTGKIGGVEVVGVYCSLSGSIILYKTGHNDINYDFGISGFLYRSNLLMYDRQTRSLWSSIWGKPVIGPLVGEGVTLEALSIVNTTWKEWKKRHPETKVLALETGYFRDYREGVANREYFSTDELLFPVPELDQSLANKDEVLAIRAPGFENSPLAISVQFLQRHPVFQDKLENIGFVVFTDRSGANRVYESGGIIFSSYDRKDKVKDMNGMQWSLLEDKLVSETGNELLRLPYHRTFWFAWFSAYPNTRLVRYQPPAITNSTCKEINQCTVTESL